MDEERPEIPTKHLLEEIRKAMEQCLTILEEEGPEALTKKLRDRSTVSRPWQFLLKAHEEHDEDHRWFSAWCGHSIPQL